MRMLLVDISNLVEKHDFHLFHFVVHPDHYLHYLLPVKRDNLIKQTRLHC